MMNHYERLEVPYTASFNEIKQAYHSKARGSHPDKTVSAPSVFHDVQVAWECLRDPKARKEYDMKLDRSRIRKEKSMTILVEDCSGPEEVLMDSTAALMYTYQCRCGDQVEIIILPDEDEFIDCLGCSLVYDSTDLRKQLRTREAS